MKARRFLIGGDHDVIGDRSILIIEDDDATRGLLRLMLEESNAEVLLSSRGEDGLERARRERPSLVLVDLMLPGVDGAEVVRRLKGDPETSGTWVIAMSAGDREDRARAEEAGCDAFVAKPFDLDYLEATIEAFLRREPV